jgi:hypothetical protein
MRNIKKSEWFVSGRKWLWVILTFISGSRFPPFNDHHGGNPKWENHGSELLFSAPGKRHNGTVLNLGKPKVTISVLNIHIPEQNHLCSVLQSNGN